MEGWDTICKGVMVDGEGVYGIKVPPAKNGLIVYASTSQFLGFHTVQASPWFSSSAALPHQPGRGGQHRSRELALGSQGPGILSSLLLGFA